MIKLFFLLSFLFYSLFFISGVNAQDPGPWTGFGIETNILAGKIIKHSSKFTAPIPALSEAVDVNFIWQTYGKKEWQQRRNFPVVGLGVTYTDYGNNHIFGRCIGVYPNIEIPLIKRPKYEWTLRIGDGLGYVTRKYQQTAPVDTLNNAIGSKLNDFAIFMTDFRLHLDDHWQLQIGANFTHISNADYHQPNLGVNMAGVHLGARYYIESAKPRQIVKELPELKRRWLVEVRLGVAHNEARAKDSLVVPSYITSFYASKRWHSVNKFFIGVDYAYHTDVYAFLKNYGVDYGHEMGHAWDGAFFAGNEFLVGRVGLVGQVGVYYHQTYLKFDPVYEKIGANFYLIQQEKGIIKELFISALLLTHQIVAQYGEFGMGVGF
jgi:hypothetical protein